jgi:hypothetical protein
MLRRIRVIPALVREDHVFASFTACTDWLATAPVPVSD